MTVYSWCRSTSDSEGEVCSVRRRNMTDECRVPNTGGSSTPTLTDQTVPCVDQIDGPIGMDSFFF